MAMVGDTPNTDYRFVFSSLFGNAFSTALFTTKVVMLGLKMFLPCFAHKNGVENEISDHVACKNRCPSSFDLRLITNLTSSM